MRNDPESTGHLIYLVEKGVLALSVTAEAHDTATVFFDDIPRALLEERRARQAARKFWCEWYLITDSEGSEYTEALRDCGVLIVYAEDPSLVRATLEAARDATVDRGSRVDLTEKGSSP